MFWFWGRIFSRCNQLDVSNVLNKKRVKNQRTSIDRACTYTRSATRAWRSASPGLNSTDLNIAPCRTWNNARESWSQRKPRDGTISANALPRINQYISTYYSSLWTVLYVSPSATLFIPCCVMLRCSVKSCERKGGMHLLFWSILCYVDSMLESCCKLKGAFLGNNWWVGLGRSCTSFPLPGELPRPLAEIDG